VNVHTAGQSIMDVTLHHSWIGSCLHLKTSDPVVVNVVAVKVTLQHQKKLKKITNETQNLQHFIRLVHRHIA